MNQELAVCIMAAVKTMFLKARVQHTVDAAIETCKMSLDFARN